MFLSQYRFLHISLLLGNTSVLPCVAQDAFACGVRGSFCLACPFNVPPSLKDFLFRVLECRRPGLLASWAPAPLVLSSLSVCFCPFSLCRCLRTAEVCLSEECLLFPSQTVFHMHYVILRGWAFCLHVCLLHTPAQCPTEARRAFSL